MCVIFETVLDYYPSKYGSSPDVTAALTHANISKQQQHEKKGAQKQNSFEQPQQQHYGWQHQSGNGRAKIFRPRDENSYNILDDDELPVEAKKAAKRAKMKQRDKMDARERRKQQKLKHKELQREYERTRFGFGKHNDMNIDINDSEATSSLGGTFFVCLFVCLVG